MGKAAKRKNLKRKNSTRAAQIQSAIDYGIDISILTDNIKRKPLERIKRHQIALDTIEKLTKARFL